MYIMNRMSRDVFLCRVSFDAKRRSEVHQGRPTSLYILGRMFPGNPTFLDGDARFSKFI